MTTWAFSVLVVSHLPVQRHQCKCHLIFAPQKTAPSSQARKMRCVPSFLVWETALLLESRGHRLTGYWGRLFHQLPEVDGRGTSVKVNPTCRNHTILFTYLFVLMMKPKMYKPHQMCTNLHTCFVWCCHDYVKVPLPDSKS